MRKAYSSSDEKIRGSFPYKSPFQAFDAWFKEICADNHCYEETNGMALATATKDGFPSCRWVLMKQYGSAGFKFFTSYSSRKGKELAENPNAALTFYWSKFNRSVRVEGVVEKLPNDDNESYWARRPAPSQISAAVSALSDQSSVIEFSGQEMDTQIHEMEKQYENKPIPKPENWGGYILKPQRFEFWAGQTSRLHDRFVFRKKLDSEEVGKHSKLVEDGWVLERLAP